MPNWVFNNIDITGDQESLDKLETMLNQPYETHYFESARDENDQHFMRPATQVYSNPVIAFRNIIAPPAEIADEYWAVSPAVKSTNNDTTDPNWFTDVLKAASVSNHWYDWNNRNWGTKWDIGVSDDNTYPNTTMDKGERYLHYSFQTAWSPVDALFVEVLSPMFPTLKFDYDYEEEQGWGGRIVFKNGEVLDSSEYDIPSSHEEFTSRDQTCVCEWNDDDPESWFDDCPRENLDTGVANVVQ